MGNRQIERIAFVATKADHVPASKRDNLRHLLQVLATGGRPAEGSTKVSHQVAASVLSTTDGTTKFHDMPVEIVRGVILGQNQVLDAVIGDLL